MAKTQRQAPLQGCIARRRRAAVRPKTQRQAPQARRPFGRGRWTRVRMARRSGRADERARLRHKAHATNVDDDDRRGRSSSTDGPLESSSPRTCVPRPSLLAHSISPELTILRLPWSLSMYVRIASASSSSSRSRASPSITTAFLRRATSASKNILNFSSFLPRDLR